MKDHAILELLPVARAAAIDRLNPSNRISNLSVRLLDEVITDTDIVFLLETKRTDPPPSARSLWLLDFNWSLFTSLTGGGMDTLGCVHRSTAVVPLAVSAMQMLLPHFINDVLSQSPGTIVEAVGALPEPERVTADEMAEIMAQARLEQHTSTCETCRAAYPDHSEFCPTGQDLFGEAGPNDP